MKKTTPAIGGALVILLLIISFLFYPRLFSKTAGAPAPLTKEDIVFGNLKPGDEFSASLQKKVGKLIRIDQEWFNAYIFSIFIYPDVTLKTYPHPYNGLGKKKNLFSCATLSGPKVETRRGLRVGDPLRKIIKYYGKWDEKEQRRYKYYLHRPDNSIDPYNGIYFDLNRDLRIRQIFIYGIPSHVAD